MHVRVIAVCLFVLALFPHSAFAQSSIHGTVTDPQSAVIPEARVALLAGQSEIRSTRTDAQGRYRFEAVPPGTYVVMASAPGFQPATGAEISVTAGQGATRDLSLALAGATDFVSVEGVARAGYRADTATIGPLGSSSILDTPYTVTVLPNELIVNGQVKNFKEASKYLPLVEFQEMQGSEISLVIWLVKARLQTRLLRSLSLVSAFLAPHHRSRSQRVLWSGV